MISIKINDKSFEAEENKTILEVAKEHDIYIPTLCFLKDINENGSCRMCLVAVKGSKKLVTACNTTITDGMEIYTENNKINEYRKKTLELLLSNHNKDCESCIRDKKCELQTLTEKYNASDGKYGLYNGNREIDDSSTYLIRDNNKCILCGRCVNVCQDIQHIGVINKNKRGIKTTIGCAFDFDIKDAPCIACGQCTLVCPTGALTERDDTSKVEAAIKDDKKFVIAATAPSVRVALGEEFGMKVGTNVKGKMVTALTELGFDKVFDINFGADLTIVEEVTELIDRINNNGVLPMFTSCSPGWIKYVEQYHPEMIPNLSTCKSPQQMFGAVMKSYYADKMKLNPKDIVVVGIMPCIAKKYEASKDDDIDVVITTRELGRLLKRKNIDFEKLEDSDFDNPMSIGASTIFGSSGGVMEAALRTLVETVTKKKSKNIDFKEVRGLKGIKEATYDVDEIAVKVAVVNGIGNAKIMIDKIKNNEVDYQFVEFMTCPGGCINGGGQPININKIDNIKELRTKALLDDDKNLPIRKAHENPQIIELYKSYFKKPGSKKAHELLHTSYQKLDKYTKKD
ncbi:MAG TPA: NADH-dependent [FeFe] hydrogenase, group A6 [Bacilli bacterium]|nr:NADH-dependent [FeFe] hydrogenase, group A6 [Bacilli bacterium]